MTKPDPSSNLKVFSHNKLAVAGMLLILLASFIAILGYLITTNHSPRTIFALQSNLKNLGCFTILRIKPLIQNHKKEVLKEALGQFSRKEKDAPIFTKNFSLCGRSRNILVTL